MKRKTLAAIAALFWYSPAYACNAYGTLDCPPQIQIMLENARQEGREEARFDPQTKNRTQQYEQEISNLQMQLDTAKSELRNRQDLENPVAPGPAKKSLIQMQKAYSIAVVEAQKIKDPRKRAGVTAALNRKLREASEAADAEDSATRYAAGSQ